MKLLITSNIPGQIYESLAKDFTITYHNSNLPLTKDQIIEALKDQEALLCPLSDKIDKDVIDACKDLKIIANYGAGFDNIDIAYARQKGIDVTNAPAPSSALSTAELTIGLILASGRKIVAGDKLTRRGEFHGWRPTFYLGHQLKKKTLGIIGMGNIGKNVARLAKAFQMEVIYYNRTRLDEKKEKEMQIKYVSKEELIREADFISLHTAFAPELKHMIGKSQFSSMKKSAILINAARGPLVDENALVQALKNDEIAGAALDVYEFEPQVTKDLLLMDKVVLAPHLGNATFEARMEMGVCAAKNLLAKKAGETLPNKVN
ncbi:2-hydroxyacid dehydrogenase family protein [Peptoniphilus sp. GNH]|nr:putative glyoxylate reductase [Clostridiales bacterium KA00134]UHR02441.1 2-hydroxyacid dehydrogenase family protein [Peptoniphilus sp. GNH]